MLTPLTPPKFEGVGCMTPPPPMVVPPLGGGSESMWTTALEGGGVRHKQDVHKLKNISGINRISTNGKIFQSKRLK